MKAVRLSGLEGFESLTTALCLLGILAVAVAQGKGSSEQPFSIPAGLPVGAKVPPFALRDQFDRTQSNETLKGPDGTILLFFRSADW